MGEEFLRLSEGNVRQIKKKKASGALPTEIPTMDEKGRCTQDYDGSGTVAGSFRVSDPKEHIDEP